VSDYIVEPRPMLDGRFGYVISLLGGRARIMIGNGPIWADDSW
jgi:hypothetical protein